MEMYGQLSLGGEDNSGGDEMIRYTNIAEAILFAFGRAVKLSEIARSCGCDQKTAKEAVDNLTAKYENMDTALCIKNFDGKYQMCTRAEYYPNLASVLRIERKPVLTEVIMETLAIIAYKSPVTKAEIEKIRGVKSDHAVNKLIEYGLVEETGRLNAPGRPALFAPTDEFYRRFDVSGKDDMPMPGPEVQAEIDEEVKEELSHMEGEPLEEKFERNGVDQD